MGLALDGIWFFNIFIKKKKLHFFITYIYQLPRSEKMTLLAL